MIFLTGVSHLLTTSTRIGLGKNEGAIKEYIKNLLQEDIATDQLSFKEYMDPFTGEPVKQGK